MSLPEGSEPIGDEELLYRRIPVSKGWYSDGSVSPEAFDPRDDESTGISIYRAKYITLQEVAKGKSKKGYFVAILRAGDVSPEMKLVPKPEPGDLGHAEIPDVTCHNRLTPEAELRKLRLAELVMEVKGPFVPEPT